MARPRWHGHGGTGTVVRIGLGLTDGTGPTKVYPEIHRGSGGAVTETPAPDRLWAEVGIDPVKVALPPVPQRQRRDDGLVGYTLRAYRPAGRITPTDAPDEVEEDPFAAEPEAAVDDLGGNEVGREPGEEHLPGTGPPAEPEEELEDLQEIAEEPEELDEEVPLFLSHRGRLLLFGSPESLVDFVRSDQPHDMRQLDEWPTVVKRIQPQDVSPSEDDTYELDLVVENLRGGHDAWDLRLLISAGEFARDAGYALRLPAVIRAMSPGSPLDDLDDTLRAAAAGGLRGMLARRRLRRFGVQQASLGWRNVINRISAAVDWHD